VLVSCRCVECGFDWGGQVGDVVCVGECVRVVLRAESLLGVVQASGGWWFCVFWWALLFIVGVGVFWVVCL